MGKNGKHFRCKSEAQKRAIAANYAKRAAMRKQAERQIDTVSVEQKAGPKRLPTKFPFWARLRFAKRRTTLVIDEDTALDAKKQPVDGYVHREATHTAGKGFEKISPNPDKDDPDPMYLRSPRKLPKYMFEPHNKDLDMPETLRARYDKNNHKNDPK